MNIQIAITQKIKSGIFPHFYLELPHMLRTASQPGPIQNRGRTLHILHIDIPQLALNPKRLSLARTSKSFRVKGKLLCIQSTPTVLNRARLQRGP